MLSARQQPDAPPHLRRARLPSELNHLPPCRPLRRGHYHSVGGGGGAGQHRSVRTASPSQFRGPYNPSPKEPGSETGCLRAARARRGRAPASAIPIRENHEISSVESGAAGAWRGGGALPRVLARPCQRASRMKHSRVSARRPHGAWLLSGPAYTPIGIPLPQVCHSPVGGLDILLQSSNDSRRCTSSRNGTLSIWGHHRRLVSSGSTNESHAITAAQSKLPATHAFQQSQKTPVTAFPDKCASPTNCEHHVVRVTDVCVAGMELPLKSRLQCATGGPHWLGFQ
eukprot:1819031-Prymnesium_polylepis.2